MKNLDNYQSGMGNVLMKQLQLLWRFVMVAVTVFLLTSNYALAQKLGTSFSQYANEPGMEEWIPGALIPNNSQYYEGTSTLQRLVLVNIKPSANAPTGKPNYHELNLKVLSTKGGVNAYDFITSFDQALKDYENITGSQVTNDNFDPTDPTDRLALVTASKIPNPATAAMISRLFQSANKTVASAPASSSYTNAIIKSAIDGYDASSYPGFGGSKRGIQLYAEPNSGNSNNAITNAKLEFLGYSAPDLEGDSYGLYKLSWESASSNILVLMGGHLATGDNGSPYEDLWLGPDAGASDISGGPYHFKLETLDGISLGNQDNQIQSGAITVFQAPCTLNNYTSVCENGVLAYTVSSIATNPTYSWSISGDGEFVDGSGNVVTPGSVASVNVRAKSGSANTFTVSVTITASGFIPSTCSDVVTVNDNPTVTVNSPTVCASALPATITATPGSGAASDYNYAWTVPSGATAAPGNVQSFTTSTAGTYSVIITHKTTGCVSPSGSGTLTINQNPTVTVNSPTVCASALPATITATPGSGAATDYNYSWTVPSGASAPGNVSSFSTSTAGTYSVVITHKTTNCSSASASGTLTINQNPTVTVNSPTVCTSALPATITATPGSGAASDYNYAWTVPSGATAPGNVQSFTTSTAGTYSVIITHKTTTCSSPSASGTLTINDNPTAPDVSYIAPECDETTFSVRVNSPSAGIYTLTQTDVPGSKEFTYPTDGNIVMFEDLVIGKGYSVTFENTSGCISGANVCPIPSNISSGLSSSNTNTLQTSDKIQKSDEVTAYPIPFDDRTTIEFKSERNGKYVINLYDMKGKLVRELKSGTIKAGETKSIEVDGKDLAEGMYLARIVSDSGSKTVKLLKRK